MSIIIIDDSLRLIPYYPNEAETLQWYQDKETCKMVDNIDFVYDIERLQAMYSYLNSHGHCFYIEHNCKLVGDCSLQDSGEIAIVVCKEYQNRKIGSRCLAAIIKFAKANDYQRIFANIYSFND